MCNAKVGRRAHAEHPAALRHPVCSPMESSLQPHAIRPATPCDPTLVDPVHNPAPCDHLQPHRSHPASARLGKAGGRLAHLDLRGNSLGSVATRQLMATLQVSSKCLLLRLSRATYYCHLPSDGDAADEPDAADPHAARHGRRGADPRSLGEHARPLRRARPGGQLGAQWRAARAARGVG